MSGHQATKLQSRYREPTITTWHYKQDVAEQARGSKTEIKYVLASYTPPIGLDGRVRLSFGRVMLIDMQKINSKKEKVPRVFNAAINEIPLVANIQLTNVESLWQKVALSARSLITYK
ncbi:hypothetical protein FQA39_LY06364 [Lamprigera yunnana]|nr:hypothetical protein FQA39_LY06364 [Lamprigera yunnana]